MACKRKLQLVLIIFAAPIDVEFGGTGLVYVFDNYNRKGIVYQDWSPELFVSKANLAAAGLRNNSNRHVALPSC